MFQRFTAAARQTVIDAQQESRRLRNPAIGTEHLLLALTLGPPADPTRAALAEAGLTHETVQAQLLRIVGTGGLDAAALSTVGIDLDEIRTRVEAEFGPGSLDEEPGPPRRWRRFGLGGHLPFGGDAKEALELGLREAIDLGDRDYTRVHLLLGLLRSPGLGLRIVEALGVSTGSLRTRLTAPMRDTA